MKKIENIKKPNFLKKLFIKLCRIIGFEIIDSIHNQFEFPVFKKKFDGVYSKKFIFNQNVIIFKPQTFMNLSGSPIKKIREFFNIDDSNFAFLSVRVLLLLVSSARLSSRTFILFFISRYFSDSTS